MPGETILIVEDNAIVAFALQHTLTRLGYTVVDPVDSGEEAVASVAAQQLDLILMDVGLAGTIDGIAAAEQIQSIAPLPVIYLTGNIPDERIKQAPCLSKPVVEQELAAVIEQVLRQKRG
jgi:CheY-like chemotaxis protein